MAGTQIGSTYDNATGARKAIKDKLSYIKTVDSKIFDIATFQTAESDTFYWNYVTYTAPSATDSKVEGSLLTAAAQPTETQFTQYTEINAKTYEISSTQQSKALNGGYVGTPDWLRRAKNEKAELLKMADEWSFVNGAGAVGDHTSTTRKMKGLITMGASGSTATATDSTFGTSVGEAVWKAHLIALKAAGGLRSAKKLTLTSWTKKGEIAAWLGRATGINGVDSSMKIYATVDTYYSHYGPIQIDGHDLWSNNKVTTLDPNEIYVDVMTETRVDDEMANCGALVTTKSIHNEMAIRYQPVGSIGQITTA